MYVAKMIGFVRQIERYAAPVLRLLEARKARGITPVRDVANVTATTLSEVKKLTADVLSFRNQARIRNVWHPREKEVVKENWAAAE